MRQTLSKRANCYKENGNDMKYILMMHVPGGPYQIWDWAKQDFQAHIDFMQGLNQRLKAAGEPHVKRRPRNTAGHRSEQDKLGAALPCVFDCRAVGSRRRLCACGSRTESGNPCKRPCGQHSKQGASRHRFCH